MTTMPELKAGDGRVFPTCERCGAETSFRTERLCASCIHMLRSKAMRPGSEEYINAATRENLKSTQERCTELLEETRAQRRKIEILETQVRILKTMRQKVWHAAVNCTLPGEGCPDD